MFQLQFNLGRSIRYHTKRRKFFDFWDKATTFSALIFSSTATYGILSTDNTKTALIAGAVVTVLSSLALVVGFASKARDHFDFVKQYAVLERQLIKEPLSEALLKEITDEKLAIESTEPPVLIVLNEMCWNEEARAQGIRLDKLKNLGFLQRCFSQFFDFLPNNIKTVEESKA
ncbi:hypothetical protein BKK53_09495 [Rodentibacter trehalosifermentans]|nr:hypothetical protein BKK53_09495 [Rodentibacter trehalosifermentans]